MRSRRRKYRRVAKRLALGGCLCLVVVVLTHAAERLNIFPSMGWGQPNSPGHYLDLISAISGVALLLAAVISRWTSN